MPEQIYIGNFAKGQITSREPFVIDNDSFPQLFNAYAWRGRVKRKRGTRFLGQLQFQVQSVLNAAPPKSWQEGQLALVADAGNLISGFTLGSTASITPGSIAVIVGGQTYTDLNEDGTLQGSGGGTGTINYATGAITISGGGIGPLIGNFSYYPGLPVMGLRDFVSSAAASNYPLLLSFDTTFSYQINETNNPKNFYNVSYYKSTNNPVTWSGQDFQQFWTTNYQGALWATNNKPGFHFEAIATVTVGSPTTITTAAPHGLISGDVIWFNELTGADAGLLNGQTATVTVTGPASFTVPINTIGKAINNTPGIFQTLTSTSKSGDGIRWYDGDPTSGSGLPTTTSVGWVNFAPPLTAATVSIDDKTAALYYLVGALAIVAFKDRLIFFSPWIQTSGGAPIQLIDVIIWSWNGTPYYTTLTPAGETSDIRGYYQDQTGLGGNLPSGLDLPIATVANNEDVLLVGFGGNGRKTRFVYSGNDLNPFLLFNINTELPSDSTFSTINLDKGAIDIGAYGIALTDQQSSQRIDLDIPDSVFQIQGLNNGVQRVNAGRDFQQEWIYFSYPVFGSAWRFPTQSFLFNYRDNTWAVFYENFTAHGLYRPSTKRTWKTTGYKSWNAWKTPWNSGSNSPLFPNVVAGNPQGYVLIVGQGTSETTSGTIQAIITNVGLSQITSIDHCVAVGDFLLITGCLGTTALNGLIGKVIKIIDKDNFVIDLPFPAGTYLGLGKFSRLSKPLIQTKQFNPYWDQGRQVRLSVQKYLMDKTNNGQVTVNVYLSQDGNSVWNDPSLNVPPNSLLYSQIMYTSPESTNLGLTPANINLQMPTASTQAQVWHRFNTSLIGDSVQIGITLNDDQMRNTVFVQEEITLHGIHLVVDKSSHLA